MMGTRQPPPVAPRTTSITLQPWQSGTAHDEGSYGDESYARSASTDSLESSGSSSSGGGGANNRMTDVGTGEYIPTRTVGKTPKLPSHNPLQFVKVQSPLYKKAEQQLKLTKEVKITREALKEGEEEWQSNLDNWKSRRRKVSEKVIQRAEEMRQIEAEEQLRQDQLLQQQKKIKKFSEIVEKKSTRSYNLELYIGQGDDSGLGGTPEPEDTLDSQSALLRSDTSEGMTSEAESVDSDISKSDKIPVKDPPKVPQKPYSRLKKTASISYDINESNSNDLFNHCLCRQGLSVSDNNSSTEPSDVEGHAADTEATSSEEDATFSGQIRNTDSGLESSGDNQIGGSADSTSDLSQDSCSGLEKTCEKQNHDLLSDGISEGKKPADIDANVNIQSFKICLKPGDNRGFGFTLKGGKDQGCQASVENVFKGGPADEIGIRSGDKIISLNGEVTTDYSHASLIFSIKQAVYIGILDIIISRSENCGNVNTEERIKEPRKGNSFAEKLALFSAGVNAESINTDESKSNAKLSEEKRESLVLRRRSAFENGKTENAVNRRSSYISNTVNVSSEKKLEKRHSVDLILSQNVAHENSISRKGPPPPVPVKPKIKSKPTLFEVNKSASFRLNDSNDDVLSPTDSIRNDFENFSGGSQNLLACLNASENFDLQNTTKQDNSSELDQFNNDFTLDKSNLHLNNLTCGPVTSVENKVSFSCDLQIDNSKNNELHESNPTSIITNFKPIDIDNPKSNFINENENSLKLTNRTLDSICDKNEMPNIETSDSLDKSKLDSDVELITTNIYEDAKSISHKTSLYIGTTSTTECAIQYVNDNTISNDVVDEVFTENNLDTKLPFIKSACQSTCDKEDINESNLTESKDIEIKDEAETVEMENSQTNPSPLYLSLEKIDEDDVISASTTTSSDTPDTETVIETLPSNLSPLPNDESNGEDSSKPVNRRDEEFEHPLDTDTTEKKSSCEINIENMNHKSIENVDIQNLDISDGILEHSYMAFSSENENVIEESFYDDQQDDDYARELDESLDQITSLDIIDRIEQSLMDQLQKDDVYEDLSSNLNSQIETGVSSPWLYFSEESEFLDDLTPRNLEPPSDPPPPPPPPEEENNEKNVMGISRTNSTKRIKKEIWRRRSDFLGIDSPEAIDADNIPPPPLGLEELLKQERAQTQWLEKQLSLPDLEAEIESTCLDSGHYSNNEYSEYYVDENAEQLKDDLIDTQIESWKENLDEVSLYDNTFGLQYDAASESLNDVIEETISKTESPQHKAKQNIQNLGAAPKAKIMDSAKWITEKVDSMNKKSIEPVLRQTSYNQNYWLTQDDERRRNVQHVDSHSDRRYSMPPVYSNTRVDVTVRTWGDREYEYQQHRPRSAIYERSVPEGNVYEKYSNMEKKDLQRTQSLDIDSHRDVNFDTDILESEVHKCSCCGKGLCEGSAMGIEALRLYFHIECFRCCLCHMQLGNGSCGTDVQVKDNQLYCPACFTID